MIPALFGVSIFVFFSIRLIPGDVVMAQLFDNPYIDKNRIDQIRHELGLDLPVGVQYLNWLGGAVKGDFGNSMITGRPTVLQIVERFPVTIELAIMSSFLSLVFAIPVGIISAVFRSSLLDYVARLFGIIGLSAPSFWIGTLIIVLPSIWWQWTPPLSYVAITTDPGRNLLQFLFPSIALGLVMAATVMRMVRSSLLDVLRLDYIKVARAKGLPGTLVITRHALKNSLIPVITVSGIQFGFLLGGTVIMEKIFALPGIGTLTLDSISRRDYTQLQANVLFLAIVFLLINLAVDLFYGWIDPRIRYS